jgi:hypothetical protein
MRTKMILGLTAAVATAAIAAPSALAAQTPTTSAAANAPQLHVSSCTVKTAKAGYTIATCPISAINMGKSTVYFSYASNLKTIKSISGAQKGTMGVPGNGDVYHVYPMKFAFDAPAAQVRKDLKVTISNPTGGAIITNATATAQS